MKFEEIWHLAWIYNRMINKHKEDKNVDYMIKFHQIISQKLEQFFPQIGIKHEDGLINFTFNGRQP